MDSILSHQAEFALIDRVQQLICDFLSQSKETVETSSLNLIQQKDLTNELGISLSTLHEWEALGLKRYSPPIEGTRKVYYHKDDVLKFLSIYPKKIESEKVHEKP